MEHLGHTIEKSIEANEWRSDVEEVDANATSIFLGFQRVHGRLNGWDAKLASRVTLAKSGGSSSTLKTCSVNWKDVCQPSKSGGIELRIFGDQHRCFLLKLGGLVDDLLVASVATVMDPFCMSSETIFKQELCNGEYHFKGGLIQDEFGRWGVGFTKLIGICSTFEVELWVIYESINLTWGRGFRRVDMEPDSLIAAKMSNA
ncbi:hypothetical protein Gotur_002742 [Gossypium turneri]